MLLKDNMAAFAKRKYLVPIGLLAENIFDILHNDGVFLLLVETLFAGVFVGFALTTTLGRSRLLLVLYLVMKST